MLCASSSSNLVLAGWEDWESAARFVGGAFRGARELLRRQSR